jgi:hypothetical protein
MGEVECVGWHKHACQNVFQFYVFDETLMTAAHFAIVICLLRRASNYKNPTTFWTQDLWLSWVKILRHLSIFGVPSYPSTRQAKSSCLPIKY